MQENLSRNYRVSGEMMLINVVQQLEQNNAIIIDTLMKNSDRWVPMLILTCGHPLSNVVCSAKKQIFGRLWIQLMEKGISINLSAWNNRLQTLIEIGEDVNALEELSAMEKAGLEPNSETFHRLVDIFSLSGDSDGCKNLIYEMARRGFPVDEKINSSLVFCFAVRGHYAKAESLIEQSTTKYGAKGREKAKGACIRAVSYRGDVDKLRSLLRNSVDKHTMKLVVGYEDVLEAIWNLAEKSLDGTGVERTQLVEQMLSHVKREFGFFHKLYREIERHIAHRHYYTALTLLEDTKRVSDCLKNQNRNVFLYQLIGRLATQLIRNNEPAHVIRDVANRTKFAFNQKSMNFNVKIYDDLLFAALMFKKMDFEQRFDYFSNFINEVDRHKEREHLVFPLLTSLEAVEDRLAAFYRLTNLGYKTWEKLEIGPLVKILLQPLHDTQRSFKDLSRLDKMGRVLKSYGMTDKQLWMIFHDWYKQRIRDEQGEEEDQWVRPFSRDLRGWCRAHYSETFEIPKLSFRQPIKVSYEKFKEYVEQGDIAKVSSVLSRKEGWPENTNFEEIVPNLLTLYLNHENWDNVRDMLASLSANTQHWDTTAAKSPLKNFHLLMVLRRLADEEDELNVRNLMDYAFELRNLFPTATCHYEGFFETQMEYNKLFMKCFERLEKKSLRVTAVDDLIEFLRSLVKLDIIQLHPSETITTFFINIVLRKMGWEDALNTWQKFLSSLHCSNGMISLLKNCLVSSHPESQKSLQYVLHRAGTFIPASRVTTMHAAVLVGLRKVEEAEKLAESSHVDPYDCILSMRLMNAVKARALDDGFILEYAKLCLSKFGLKDSPENAQIMFADLLRICDKRQMGPTALRLYELFSDNGVPLQKEERDRLAAAIEKHATLAKKWMYRPEGMLNIKDDDEIITGSEEARIEERMRKEILVER